MASDQFSEFITFLYTADLDKTSQFYETVLGFKMVLDQGKCRIFHVSSGGYLGFCIQNNVEIPHRAIILTLVTEDVDHIYDKLVRLNTSIEKPPQINQEFGIYHCFFRDPNGYLLEVQRFLDPDWHKIN